MLIKLVRKLAPIIVTEQQSTFYMLIPQYVLRLNMKEFFHMPLEFQMQIDTRFKLVTC